MIIPNKYKNLSQNIFGLGKDVIEILNKQDLDIYHLYKKVLERRMDDFDIELSLFFFSLDFLYTLGIINMKEETISLV